MGDREHDPGVGGIEERKKYNILINDIVGQLIEKYPKLTYRQILHLLDLDHLDYTEDSDATYIKVIDIIFNGINVDPETII